MAFQITLCDVTVLLSIPAVSQYFSYEVIVE